MATPQTTKKVPKDFFSLSPELRNMVYRLVLEDDKKDIPGDNRAAVMDEEDHFSVDWRSLKQTKLPAICQVHSQVKHEALGLLFSDYLPAMNVFRFGGGSTTLTASRRGWISSARVSCLTCVVQREEVHAKSASVDGVAVAITHIHGQVVGENVAAWVEYAAVEILAKLEELLPNPDHRRLSVKKLKGFAKFCVKNLERGDDDSDDGGESDEETEEETEEGGADEMGT
ncbi:hypothetical protein M409DRAFT_49184 [Zasmidium cellare ATCC 36951]|uniref:Uncharacterized protein n=1 Tax=Zasmidium cellare ATCC 36951 TaxID=1080233 RepID=A0A6A6CZU7_ZASCE|nr:uncharacterized protein M409DRAFT_49184 [Zasmidium cellare ATCC 36951]KAF2172631.1 hypothetical protein M409DRAFT_49184 [Zasmidium cellare ATCC 36951]